MNENKDIERMEQIKYYLRVKEKTITNSQIKQNKMTNQLKKLEMQKNNIINNKKNIFSKIISFILYNSAMLSILILFLSSILRNFILTPLLMACIYVVVITISITGAYVSSRIEEKIRKYYYRKKLKVIINKINKKKEEINLEKEKQAILKKEITKIMNYSDKKTPEINMIKYNLENNITYKNNNTSKKTKKKIKKI